MILSAAVLALMASVLLQGVFAALGPFLTEDLGLSRAQLGGLTTALYVTGSSLSLAAGPIVDRVDPRKVLFALFAVSAVSAAVVAAAPSYVLIVAAALVGGLAVAFGNPVTNLLVTLHAPRERQGLFTGVKQAGVQGTIFLGGAALPPIAALAGWRVATAVAAALPLAGLVVAWVAVPSSPRRARVGTVTREVLPDATRWLAVYGFGMGCGISALGAYLALYGVQRLDLTATTAGLLAATVGGVGVVARIAWGWFADRTRAGVPRTLALQGVASMAAVSLVALAEQVGAPLAWAGAVLAGLSASAWNVVGMLVIVRSDPAVSGRMSAIVVGAFYLGYGVGPTAFGLIVDATSSYGWGWALIGTAFAVATVVALWWSGRAGHPPGTLIRKRAEV